MEERLTPYQRGNRDGLLALAQRLRAAHDAAMEDLAQTKAKETAKNRAAVALVCQGIAGQIRAYTDAIAWAERAAEALPEEP